jgi:hypothetical protein
VQRPRRRHLRRQAPTGAVLHHVHPSTPVIAAFGRVVAFLQTARGTERDLCTWPHSANEQGICNTY